MAIRVRHANAADLAAIVSTLDTALGDDPVAQWLFPGPHDQDRRHLVLRELIAYSMAAGTVLVGGGTSVQAAALWLDCAPDSPWLPDSLVDRLAVASGTAFSRLLRLMTLADRDRPAHRVYQYLPLMAVEPQQQRGGLGRALMLYRMAECDERDVPTYVAASTAHAVAFYARLGYRPTGAAVRPHHPGGPTVWPMWRWSAESREGQPLRVLPLIE